MNKQIAVLQDGNGKTSSILKSGVVKVYSKDGLVWKKGNEIIFGMDNTMDLDMIREKINEMAESLGECKIFVGSKIDGIVYTIFERLGINAWEIEGDSTEYLDYVLEKEVELENAKVAEEEGPPTPVRKGKFGSYFLNYIKVEENSDKYTTKQVILPFLHDANYEDLTVVCSHVPKWFQKEFESLGLEYSAVENEKHEIIVIIKHKKL